MERRKVAWARARINPDLKSLALEEYKDRKDKLFGPEILEKASKKLEADKALAKVSAPPLNPRKRARTEEQLDLIEFFIQRQEISAPDKAVQQPPVSKQLPAIQLSVSQAASHPRSQTSHPRRSDSCSPRRELTTLPAGLVSDHHRPWVLGVVKGYQLELVFPDCPSGVKGKFPEGMAGNKFRNPGSASKADHSCSTTMYRPVHQQAVCDSEERQIIMSSNQPETTKLLYGEPSVQDGRDRQGEGVVEGRGLDVYSGFKGHLSLSPHCKAAQEISEICVGGNHIRVHPSTIWSVQCTKDLYESTEASYGPPMLSKTENSDLPRQYIDNGQGQRHLGETGALHSPTARTVGMHHQCSEVSTRINPPNCVSRAPGQLRNYEAISTRGKNTADHQRLQPSTVEECYHGTAVSLGDWQIVCSSPTSVTGTPSPPAPSTPVDSDTGSFRILQVTSDTEPRLPGGNDVVDPPAASLEWMGHYNSPTRIDNTVGCVTKRVGGQCATGNKVEIIGQCKRRNGTLTV